MPGGSADGPNGATRQGAPHGITLFDHAQIAAEIAEGDRSSAEVLEAHELTDAAWNESSMYWMKRIGDDALEHGQDARIVHVYSEAFSKAQDALKPVVPMDAAAYAKLIVDVQLAGGPAEPSALRALSTADYIRLARHWARVLSSDPAQAAVYFETYAALHEADAPLG